MTLGRKAYSRRNPQTKIATPIAININPGMRPAIS
jgi:hypothetical protein